MSVLNIGHASIDERGRINGGQAGDQTGKEVCIRGWYAGGWNLLLRPKSAEVAERMAAACETLCRGNLVGYDQYQRNSLWDELEKVGWDAGKLTVKCETDCSAFMAACARCAGVNVPRVSLGGGKYNAPVTGTMRRAFTVTGQFDALTARKYLDRETYLKRGDILVRESGHTAMVLSYGGGEAVEEKAAREVKASEAAQAFDRLAAGTYVCNATALNVRDGAGTGKKVLTTLRRGDAVQCYGYLSVTGSIRWLYVQFVRDGVRYTGFASAQYLQKKEDFGKWKSSWN